MYVGLIWLYLALEAIVFTVFFSGSKWYNKTFLSFTLNIYWASTQ